VETIGALEDRSGDQQPAAGYRDPLKRRTKDDDVRRTPKGLTFKKRQWTRPECNSGIRDRGARLQLPSKIFRRTIKLEIEKLIVGSSVRLRRKSVWAVWRSQPPPKRK
jgi:hypothetical protein